MQRLLALRQQAQRRASCQHLPAGFFTSSSSSAFSSTPSRVHHFSDSSRSRPPSSKNGSGRTGTPAAKAANGRKGTATVTVDGTESSSGASTTTTSNGQPSSTARPGFGRRSHRLHSSSSAAANSSNSSSRRRIPFEPVVEEANDTTSAAFSPFRLPSTLKPQPILFTPPNQISLDSFYSLHRPLLEVTIPPGQRRSVSESDKKPMAIVGEPEDTMSDDMDINGQELEGVYDAYLIAEPHGSDPAWGEGTEAYLADLSHNVPPPVPAPVDVDVAASDAQSLSASHNPTSSSSAPVDPASQRRQEAIDYLFPFYDDVLPQSGGTSDLMEYMSGLLTDNDADMASLSQKSVRKPMSRTGLLPVHGEAHRFLTAHQLKNRWSGIWEWEGVSKALNAAEKKYAHGQRGSTKAADTTATTAGESSSSTVHEPIEKLRQIARSKARGRLRAKRAKRQGSTQGGALPEFVELEDIFKGQGPNDGRVMVISMPLESDPSSPQTPSSSSKGGASTSALTKKERADERKAFDAEVRTVIDQARKFAGFFSKSVAFENGQQGSKGEPGASTTPARDGQNSDMDDIEVVHLEFEPKSGKFTRSEARSDEWVDMEEQEGEGARALDPRLVTGPRTGVVQCGRGRALSRTLRERLEARGVELVGQHRTIVLDSVKRKRRKRISKHKYKKRRKATRAERRKAGK